MEICTIGFTKHGAERFFGLLNSAGVRRLVDVRLNNTGQLAGFSKKSDLQFFLDEICDGADYFHEPELLAPSPDLFRSYRNGDVLWDEYEERFLDLMAERRVEEKLPAELFTPRSALLCTEHTPERCHRRLVVEYLGCHWPDVTAVHL